jgi:hypothetical protein
MPAAKVSAPSEKNSVNSPRNELRQLGDPAHRARLEILREVE